VNRVTEHYFNHFPQLRYVTDHDMPDYARPRIVDRQTRGITLGEYRRDGLGVNRTVRDSGVLTVMRNPFNASRYLIGVMGIGAFGTDACFRVLTTNRGLRTLLNLLPLPLGPRGQGIQVIVDIDVARDEIVIREDRLVILNGESRAASSW
jgi:hypothetical protein